MIKWEEACWYCQNVPNVSTTSLRWNKEDCVRCSHTGRDRLLYQTNKERIKQDYAADFKKWSMYGDKV